MAKKPVPPTKKILSNELVAEQLANLLIHFVKSPDSYPDDFSAAQVKELRKEREETLRQLTRLVVDMLVELTRRATLESLIIRVATPSELSKEWKEWSPPAK